MKFTATFYKQQGHSETHEVSYETKIIIDLLNRLLDDATLDYFKYWSIIVNLLVLDQKVEMAEYPAETLMTQYPGKLGGEEGVSAVRKQENNRA